MHGTARTQVMHTHMDGSAWTFATRPVLEPLRPYIRDFSGYSESSPPLIRRELPGPQVVVIFEFGPPIRLIDPEAALQGWPNRGAGGARETVGRCFPGGFVAGLDDRATLTAHDGFQAGLQVNFTPLGARLFFGFPMSELAGQVVSVADLMPGEHVSITERLEALPHWDARFDLLEGMMAARLAGPHPRTDLVAWALRHIEASGGLIDVRELADGLGYSQKHLIAMFRDQVGVPPKRFARLVRFDRLVRRLKAGGSSAWADLALELGYADQSHLVREVRAFTGLTPTDARAVLETIPAPFGLAPTGDHAITHASSSLVY